MMATQELVVPKSIPITSPASSDFHRLAKSEEDGAANDCFVVTADVRLSKEDLATESMFCTFKVNSYCGEKKRFFGGRCSRFLSFGPDSIVG